MGNIVLKFMKNKNNNKTLTDEEEMQLLEELAQKIDKKETLSTPHKHIMKEIAYKMLVNNPCHEIINKPKQQTLTEEQIADIIHREDNARFNVINNDIQHIRETIGTINSNIEKIFKLLETLEVV